MGETQRLKLTGTSAHPLFLHCARLHTASQQCTPCGLAIVNLALLCRETDAICEVSKVLCVLIHLRHHRTYEVWLMLLEGAYIYEHSAAAKHEKRDAGNTYLPKQHETSSSLLWRAEQVAWMDP